MNMPLKLRVVEPKNPPEVFAGSQPWGKGGEIFDRGDGVCRSFRRSGTLAAVLLAGLLPWGQALAETSVEYLCCDWGPAMTLPTKTNEVAQFNDAEDEIYFLKQVISTSRRDVGIYLCKMKADGSGKTEIKKLWHNPNYPIDTQAQTTWMDVNRKTRKIAISVTYAGSDLTGLWRVNLDGSELKRVITPALFGGHLQRIDSPSWAPDGEWIVCCEETEGMHLMKCDKNGQNLMRYKFDEITVQPRVSPDGIKILYVVIGKDKGGLSIMDIDGDNAHFLSNPDDKRWRTHGGKYPAWSPDGKRIFYIGVCLTIVDPEKGKILWTGEPGGEGLVGWSHWGKQGFVGYAIRGLLIADSDLREAKLIAPSHMVEAKSKADRW